MSLSTKCLHVSSTLWPKAELVLCGGIINGRENRVVTFGKNIVRKLSQVWNGMRGSREKEAFVTKYLLS